MNENTGNTSVGARICYVFGAGDGCELRALPGADDLVIAADGGLRLLESLGIRPDVTLGDFDSLDFIPEGE